MAHGDVAVAGVGRSFDRSRPRHSCINYCLSQCSFNNLETTYSFDGSRSGAMEEYGSYCEFAFPWTIKTSIQRCPGPGKVWIDVIRVREHRCNPCARRPKCGVGETNAPI